MHVLVTGGSGFVCLNIVEKLLKEGAAVTVFDRAALPSAALCEFGALPGKLTCVTGDITDREALERVLESGEFTHIVHGAAVTPSDEQEARDPVGILNINLGGTVQVLEYLRSHPQIRLLFLSSMAACGSTLTESDCISEDELTFFPVGTYGIAKFTSEQLILRYQQLYGLNATVVRLGTVFGPWEYPSQTRRFMSPALRILQAFSSHDEVTLTRFSKEEWVYSRQVAEYVQALLTCPSCTDFSYCLVSGFSWDSELWCRLACGVFPGRTYRLASPGEEPLVRVVRPRDNARIADARLFRQISLRPVYDETASFNDYMEWLSGHPDFLSL